MTEPVRVDRPTRFDQVIRVVLAFNYAVIVPVALGQGVSTTPGAELMVRGVVSPMWGLACFPLAAHTLILFRTWLVRRRMR